VLSLQKCHWVLNPIARVRSARLPTGRGVKDPDEPPTNSVGAPLTPRPARNGRSVFETSEKTFDNTGTVSDALRTLSLNIIAAEPS